MKSDALPLVEWSLLLAGLVLGHYLTIQVRFAEHAGEYVRRALRELWPLVVAVVIAEWILGIALFRLSQLIPGPVVFGPIGAAVSGLSAALLPLAFEQYWVKTASVDSLKKAFVKKMIELGIFALQRIEEKVQGYMEDDNFAWQHCEHPWDFKAEADEIGRRIRKLYEHYKLSIANKQRKPKLMLSGEGYFPGQQFYLLVKYLGPKKLQRKLSREVSVPKPSWNGKEQRRRLAGPGDRRKAVPGDKACRSYEDQELLARIKRGRALADWSQGRSDGSDDSNSHKA